MSMVEDDRSQASGESAKSSAERRQRIIQQLLNKRKQNVVDSGSHSDHEAAEQTWARSLGTNFPVTHDIATPLQQSYSDVPQPARLSNHHFDAEPVQEPEHYAAPPPPPPLPAETWAESPQQKQAPGRTPTRSAVKRSLSAGRNRSSSTSRGRSDSYMNGRAADDSQVGDTRTHRILQADALIKQEMFKECTFKPRINTTAHRPSADDNTPFYDRATKWQITKEQDAIKRKATLEKAKEADWTFRPKINRNSVKSVKELRGDVGDVSTRLYRGSEEIAAMKAKFIEDEQRREQEIEARQCTFQPQCVTDKTKFAYVAPKYNTVEQKQPKESTYVDASAKECTFTPKVKGVRPNMSSARLYLESNVVDRLSKLIVPGDPADTSMDQGERPIMDMASFMNSLHLPPPPPQFSTPSSTKQHSSTMRPGSASSTTNNRQSTGGIGGVTLFGPRGGGGVSTPGGTQPLTAEEKERRRAQFEQFLGRQALSLVKKERNIKEVEQSETPHFKPDICRKSVLLAKQHSDADFLDRMEKSAIKKADANIRRSSSGSVGEEHTFQPKISQKSEKLRARTVFEMSRGDMLKQESNVSNIKLRLKQEQDKEYSFKPKITAKAKEKKSVLADPQFLDTYRTRQERKDAQRQEALREREQKEYEQCTFAPTTKDCPSYIAKIAASMNAIHNARGPVSVVASEKPQWK